MSRHSTQATFDSHKLLDAVWLSFARLGPLYQMRNPVMFVVYVGALLTFALSVQRVFVQGDEPFTFVFSVTLCLWLTVLFANFAEAYAEGRGKAQAETLKKARREIEAKKLRDPKDKKAYVMIAASSLRQEDIVLVESGDFIPVDGQVIDGIATVDESAITGESAPVIRESGGDRDAVTGGTRVLSDWLLIRVTMEAGQSYLDKMISMVEGAKRQKTPNEIALGILLAAMTIVFLVSCATILPFSMFSVARLGQGSPVSVTVIIALLVCLAPTTIGGLLSAIGIAGMNRLIRANIVATSGRAVEAAGDVNVLLLDKTGTITHGNRQAVQLFPASNISMQELAEAAFLSSCADKTPEGKSISELAYKTLGSRPPVPVEEFTFIPFSATTRASGITIGDSRAILKGASDVIKSYVEKLGGSMPQEATQQIGLIARQGGTPLVVADGARVLGVIFLKDVVKAGIKERLASLRAFGIKSVMITGDNPVTAAAIASEAGVDDFIAEATPEAKLVYIRKMQEDGELVAMVGDGTNDAPALAQADVAVAMNSGTQAAKEAGNMVDLDSNPTKLIEIVEIGKQLLMTRGALTTFSLANDIAKYFAIIPAVFIGTYPALERLNLMGLSSPRNAILSALIFNAIILILLVPLAMRGVAYKPVGAARLLSINLLTYGGGGVIVPFVGIKLIDLILALFLGSPS